MLSNPQTRKTRCKFNYEHPLTKRFLVALPREKQEKEFGITTRLPIKKKNITALDSLKRILKYQTLALEE